MAPVLLGGESMTCKRCSDGEATYCITCMNDIMTETDKALERAEARIVKLRAALEELINTSKVVSYWDNT